MPQRNANNSLGIIFSSFHFFFTVIRHLKKGLDNFFLINLLGFENMTKTSTLVFMNLSKQLFLELLF